MQKAQKATWNPIEADDLRDLTAAAVDALLGRHRQPLQPLPLVCRLGHRPLHPGQHFLLPFHRQCHQYVCPAGEMPVRRVLGNTNPPSQFAEG